MHFCRTYLSRQVADRLAAELRVGAWQNNLPGERKLAAFFGVSRRTIRAALDILARKGTFRSGEGRRISVAFPKSLPVKSGQKTAVLIVSAVSNRLPHSFDMVSSLEHYFALSGYTLQVEAVPARVNLHHWLEKVYNQRASVWLLCSVAKEVQHWFDQRNLPSLILGSRHEGIHLPDLDIDYRAVCRHAANTLLRLGHRRIVFLNVAFGFAGDLASERGFNEAISAFTSGPVTARIVRHNGNIVQIGHLLNRLFTGAEAPTAMIVSHACYTMRVLGHLGLMGKRIPADVSVICRDDDPLFEFILPSPAHYCVDRVRLARRAVQLAVGIDQCAFLPSTSSYLMSQFVPGESLATARVIRKDKN